MCPPMLCVKLMGSLQFCDALQMTMEKQGKPHVLCPQSNVWQGLRIILSLSNDGKNHQTLAVKDERYPTCSMESNPVCRNQDLNLGHSSERGTCYHSTTKRGDSAKYERQIDIQTEPCNRGFSDFLLILTELVKFADRCSSNPCTNDGTCISNNAERYTCRCHPGFYGINCEISKLLEMK